MVVPADGWVLYDELPPVPVGVGVRFRAVRADRYVRSDGDMVRMGSTRAGGRLFGVIVPGWGPDAGLLRREL